jgi:hypothetical protein
MQERLTNHVCIFHSPCRLLCTTMLIALSTRMSGGHFWGQDLGASWRVNPANGSKQISLLGCVRFGGRLQNLTQMRPSTLTQGHGGKQTPTQPKKVWSDCKDRAGPKPKISPFFSEQEKIWSICKSWPKGS